MKNKNSMGGGFRFYTEKYNLFLWGGISLAHRSLAHTFFFSVIYALFVVVIIPFLNLVLNGNR